MDLAYTVLIQLIILKTATLFVLIDEETETEMVNDEEEEDLNDVPLFDNSEEHVEPFHLDESFHIPPAPLPPPDGNSFAPQLDPFASEVREEDLQEEEAIEIFFAIDVDVRIIATNTSVSLTLEQEGLTC